MRPALPSQPFLLAVLLLVLARSAISAETSPPADLGAMLEHAAIVENMVSACGHARPDLATQLGEARETWWKRNSRVADALHAIEQAPATPYRNAALQLYHALQRSLQEQIDTLRQTGHTEYLQQCDGLPQELTSGRLDYRMDNGSKPQSQGG